MMVIVTWHLVVTSYQQVVRFESKTKAGDIKMGVWDKYKLDLLPEEQRAAPLPKFDIKVIPILPIEEKKSESDAGAQ